jgi:hypothetical protein
MRPVKNILFLVALAFMTCNLHAQIAMGTWRLHVATGSAIDVANSDQYIFTAYENGILRYDFTTKEKRIYTSVQGLSDIQISTILYDSIQNALYVGYKNGNIDKITSTETINIPALKQTQLPGSKKINRFYRDNDYVYVATDFSVLQLDPNKDEIKETFYPTNGTVPIIDVTVVGPVIYALTPGKLLLAEKANPLLPSQSAWTNDNRLESLFANSYAAIEKSNDELFVLFKTVEYGSDTVYHLTPAGREIVTNYPFTLEINNITTHLGFLDVLADGAALSYGPDLQLSSSVLSFYLGIWFEPLQMCYANNNKWIADEKSGLLRIAEDVSYEQITYPGPPNNDYYAMDWKAGKLAVATGRLEFKTPGYLKNGFYTFEDEGWDYSDPVNTAEWDSIDIHDFIDVSVNPTNKEEIAVSTYSAFPVSVVNKKEGTCEVFDNLNSPLQLSLAGNGWALASDVSYDEKGNLWVLNGLTNRPLSVLDKNDVWYSFDCGVNARNKYTTKMIVDYNDNVWMATESGGLFGFNYNNTLSNPSDDKLVNISSTELNSIDINSSNITAIAVDFDNEIWIGTDAGFAVLYNSDAAFDAAGEYSPQRIKVNFEGNVEYVLGSTHITDIEVDGGNRKWMATASAGILLLSADGSEILEQFTKDNSPLISDNIYDLKIDHNTGELFIITDLGLVSYRANATYEDPEYSNVIVFPNPVRPNYEGLVTIQGIRYDSDVKVTDISGNLVYKTTSNGGTATWNGRTLDGQKAASGVYLIWTATNLGSSRKVGKVVLVN